MTCNPAQDGARRFSASTRSGQCPSDRSDYRRGTGSGVPLGPASDEVLDAARANAAWALTRLYESLAPSVVGYIRSQGVNDAEDLTSEVFLAVLSRPRSFSGTQAQFRIRVFAIAHLAVDARRRKGRGPEKDPRDAAATTKAGSSPAAGNDILRSAGTGRALRLLAALAPDQRNVLALRLIAHMSVDEVAATLSQRPEAVRAIQGRAMASLRRMVDDPRG